MTTTERSDLINAVLASRDELEPYLETELLEAIVDAETGHLGDGEAAMRAIDMAVSAAIERGVGNQKPEAVAGESIGSEDEDDEA